MITIYIKGLIDKISRIAYLTMKIYIMNNLKANILINIDILTS